MEKDIVKNKLQLNQEYTYKQICEILDVPITTGTAKQKQIKAIEDSYEYYHPINKKTKKEKKSYVFTKKLKDIELIDGRKNHNTIVFPDEEFEYLLSCMLNESQRYQSCVYYRLDLPDSAYLTTGTIYSNFGINIYDLLNRIGYEKDDTKIKKLFSSICIECVKSFTISRICRKLGYKKNSLPKGIVRNKGKRSSKQVIDDKLLDKYNEYEKELLERYNLKDVRDAVSKDMYLVITKLVKEQFEELDEVYGIQRTNVISYDYSKSQFLYDGKKRKQYQQHFREMVLTSVKNSIINRVKELKPYKLQLTSKEKYYLRRYYRQFLQLCYEDNDISCSFYNHVMSEIGYERNENIIEYSFAN